MRERESVYTYTQPLKIYVASTFGLIPDVETVVAALEHAGHEITVKWWAREYEIDGELIPTTTLKLINHVLTPGEFYAKPETKFSFNSDFNGIKDADAFVFVAARAARAYNGANIELGIAIGDSKPCFSLGTLDLSVLYYPVTQCRTINELLGHLRDLQLSM